MGLGLSQGWHPKHQDQSKDLQPEREGKWLEEERRKEKRPSGLWRNGYYLWGGILDLQGLQAMARGIKGKVHSVFGGIRAFVYNVRGNRRVINLPWTGICREVLELEM